MIVGLSVGQSLVGRVIDNFEDCACFGENELVGEIFFFELSCLNRQSFEEGIGSNSELHDA